MIPGSLALKNPPDWQAQLAGAVREPRVLLDRLGLRESDLGEALWGGGDFPLRVPEAYLARMRPGDPRDPLLRQVLPLAAEGRAQVGYLADPLGEQAASPLPGLIHKYRNRVLLVASPVCAIHCRYCFRRHFPYQRHLGEAARMAPILAYLAAHREIEEVILSGGDPLSLADPALAWLSECLQGLPQVRTLRIHTRLPVVLPARVDEALLAWLSHGPARKVVVLHVNHPNEVDEALALACRRLRDSGATLLNQSVLLGGVNDSAAVLAELSERLFDAGVLPYYLHLLDPVSGSAHFAVAAGEVAAIYSALQRRLSGYLLPRLVREVPGLAHKMLVDPGAWAGGAPEGLRKT